MIEMLGYALKMIHGIEEVDVTWGEFALDICRDHETRVLMFQKRHTL